MISSTVSSSARNLFGLHPSILTCQFTDQINSLSIGHLVIFISETSVVFVISSLFLQLQRLPIHSSPANLIIVIHSTNGISQARLEQNTAHTKYSGSWTLQIHTNFWTHYSQILGKNWHWLPIKQYASSEQEFCAFLHMKDASNSATYLIFTVVY